MGLCGEPVIIMKLAYFSPLPPQKSGISDYSEALLPYLSNYFDIDLWVSGIIPDKRVSKKYRVIDYHKSKSRFVQLRTYDCILYNLGNNPEFHVEMYEAFLENPGYVILHDFVLFYLITGYHLEYHKDREGYIQEFYENHENEGIHAVKNLLRDPVPPLQFKNPEMYPLIKKVIEKAEGIIVHSESTKKMLLLNGCPPQKIAKINQINYSDMNFNISRQQIEKIKKKYGIDSNALLITSLGYIAPTKRNEQVIKAIKEIISTSKIPIQYLMAGEGNYIDGLLDNNIKKTGFIPKDDYEKIVACSDIIVNLRYPSMGETSATVIQAMTAGKPCVVSDAAWFSELPDNSVIKISIDYIKENDNLVQSLMVLISDEKKRKEFGKNAQEYALMNHAPRDIAKQVWLFLSQRTSDETNDFMESYSVHNSKILTEIFHTDNSMNLLKNYEQINKIRLDQIGLKENKPKVFQRIKNFILGKSSA